MAALTMEDNGDGWSYPHKPQYQSTMVEFMTFFHGVEYARDATFTREDLLEITPLDIKRFFFLERRHMETLITR